MCGDAFDCTQASSIKAREFEAFHGGKNQLKPHWNLHRHFCSYVDELSFDIKIFC